MEGITGIQHDWEGPPAPDIGSGPAGLDPVLAAYRRFLLEPGVENDFYAAKARAQRAVWMAGERRRLQADAAAAEVEAGRLSRSHDDEQRRRFSFATGTSLAVCLAAVDAVPAFLAAQAFGLDLWTTAGITALLVAGLAAAMWAVSHQTGGARRLIVTGLGAGLVAVGALRWWYLVVTSGDLTSAVVEALGLTVFTALLVGFGVLALDLTKSRRVSVAERQARWLRRQAAAAGAAESDATRKASIAMREHAGRAQVFASRDLDEADARRRFVEHVRHEVERDAERGAHENEVANVT